MDDVIGKIDKIYKQLEDDRLKALEEYDQIRDEAALIEPRYRHKVREIGGIFLKLAIDSSIGMAKIIEPILKNEAVSASSFSGRKELLELLDSMDKKPLSDEPVQSLEDGTTVDDPTEEDELPETNEEDK